MLLERVQTTLSANKNFNVLYPNPFAQVIDNDHSCRQAGYALDKVAYVISPVGCDK